MERFSRFLVALFIMFFVQSSLGANAALKDFSNVTTKSFGQNGYHKLPDGLIIQWGYNSGGANKTIYLPTTFYDANYAVLTTSDDGNQAVVLSHNVIARYTSYFKVTSTYINNSAITGTAGTGFMFIAIGRWK